MELFVLLKKTTTTFSVFSTFPTFEKVIIFFTDIILEISIDELSSMGNVSSPGVSEWLALELNMYFLNFVVYDMQHWCAVEEYKYFSKQVEWRMKQLVTWLIQEQMKFLNATHNMDIWKWKFSRISKCNSIVPFAIAKTLALPIIHQIFELNMFRTLTIGNNFTQCFIRLHQKMIV